MQHPMLFNENALCDFVIAKCRARDDLTPLKIQKLMFYAFGIGCAGSGRNPFAGVEFFAWKHGPVVPSIYRRLKHFGSSNVSAAEVEESAARASQCVGPTWEMAANALKVYGLMGPWDIRQESHLERPWSVAHAQREGASIDGNVVVDHFRDKFFSGKPVPIPQYLLGSGSLAIDGIPVPTVPDFESLVRLASGLWPKGHG